MPDLTVIVGAALVLVGLLVAAYYALPALKQRLAPKRPADAAPSGDADGGLGLDVAPASERNPDDADAPEPVVARPDPNGWTPADTADATAADRPDADAPPPHDDDVEQAGGKRRFRLRRRGNDGPSTDDAPAADRDDAAEVAPEAARSGAAGVPATGWVMPALSVNGNESDLVSHALAEAKRLDALLDRLEASPDAPGQGDLAESTARLLVLVDAVEASGSDTVGSRSWAQVKAKSSRLEQGLLDLVTDSPVDAVHVMPMTFPAAFSSHVPAFGVVPDGPHVEGFNVVSKLMGLGGVASAPQAAARVGGVSGFQAVGETVDLAQDDPADADDLATDELAAAGAVKVSGRKNLWRSLDLPEPLPDLDR